MIQCGTISSIPVGIDEQLENTPFLTQQLITYLGNKRSLLGFIGKGLEEIQSCLGMQKMRLFDVFSGSGIVARYFKRFSNLLVVNDLERYSEVINRCYLSNAADRNMQILQEEYDFLLKNLLPEQLADGIISDMYSPKDDEAIKIGERVFYTRRNARYIDTARRLIDELPENDRLFFLAPLLSEASIHANTAGVFKGFYKNPLTGIGEFGGKNHDALDRITGHIELPFPVFSNFSCDSLFFQNDANAVIYEAPEVDVAYIDPPYNQHPYGSNYFMLNTILDNRRHSQVSEVSGIPADWNRSDYNKSNAAYHSLEKLVTDIKAKFVLISFNSDGFISLDEMKTMLCKIGKLEVLETPYNTFRASRNLSNRKIHIKEYLYLLKK